MKKQDLSFNLRYMLVHGFYQVLMILVSSYASVFLLFHGYSDGAIGVILAIGNLTATFLQPAIGDFLDRHPSVTLQLFMCILLAIQILFSIVMLVLHGASLPFSFSMVIVLSLVMSMQPLINSLCYLMESSGIFINFGICRGFGSASYAVVSAVMGIVLAKINKGLLPGFYIAAFVLLGISFLSIGSGKKKGSASAAVSASAASAASAEKALPFWTFVRTYRRYMAFLFGTMLVMVPFFASGSYFTYQILESIGYGTKETGYAMAIAAIVELPAMVITGPLMQKYKLHWLLRISGIFFLVKCLILIMARTISVFYIGELFQCVSFGIFFPCATAYTHQVLPEADMIKGQSLLTAMLTVTGTVATFSGGLLLDIMSPFHMLLILFAAALIGIVILWVSVGERKTDRV